MFCDSLLDSKKPNTPPRCSQFLCRHGHVPAAFNADIGKIVLLGVRVWIGASHRPIQELVLMFWLDSWSKSAKPS